MLTLACVAGCAGGSEATPEVPTSAVQSTVTTADDFTEASTTDARVVVDGPLAGVCPSVIGVQTAGLPGVAVGPLHALLGDTPVIDDARQSVTGALTRPDGTVEDVQLELRSGGPAVGFRSPADLLVADDTLLLAQVPTAEAALGSGDSVEITGVTTLTDATHRVVIWDPQTFPDVSTFEDLRAEAVEVRHVTDSSVIDFLVSTGQLDVDQVVPGFDGEPASFVAARGGIAQLGDVLVDPALFASLPQWGRPVATLSPRSVGWLGHDDMLVVRSDDIEGQRACLERLVPIIQSAIVAYASEPTAVNSAMSAARASANPLTRLTPELMDEGAATGLASGVFGNGANGTIGDFEIGQLDEFVQELLEQTEVAPIDIDQIVTNEFIDPSIGL